MVERERHPTPEDSVERVKRIVLRWMDEIWKKRHIGAVDELHADHFIDHSPAGRDPDSGGFKEGLVRLFAAFPDFRAETEGLVIDGTTGQAAIRWSAEATHLGEYLGIQPGGRLIRFSGIEILRIEHDQIVERWGEWDGLDLVEQLSRRTKESSP